MKQINLLSLHHLEKEIKSAINHSIYSFPGKFGPDMWAKKSLRRNIENSLDKVMTQNVLLNPIHGNGNPPLGGGMNGFKAVVGIQILVGYKVRFKASANIGYGGRSKNFGATSSLHFSAYNGGLGVGAKNKKLVVDVTAAVNLTVGDGISTPLQSYALNYNSPIPNLNNFQNSFSYGQLLTWNSALNQNKFSLNDIQRQGMIGFRLGDANISTNNDTGIGYFGDNGDRGWTGGISIATPFFEIGFQDFSGNYMENAATERELKKYKDQIKKVKDDKSLSKNEKINNINLLERRLKDFTDNNLHTQSQYQQKLNKASTYFRINADGYNATIDVIGDAWLQNLIHRAIKDLRFDYQHKKVEVWTGKNW